MDNKTRIHRMNIRLTELRLEATQTQNPKELARIAVQSRETQEAMSELIDQGCKQEAGRLLEIVSNKLNEHIEEIHDLIHAEGNEELVELISTAESNLKKAIKICNGETK